MNFARGSDMGEFNSQTPLKIWYKEVLKMKDYQVSLLILKGLVADMDETEREQFEQSKAEISAIVGKYGAPGVIGLSFVANKKAAELGV